MAALVLGLACGIALLMKFNIGVGAFASGATLLGLRAARAAVESEAAESKAAELNALFAFWAGFAVASAVFFAPLDFGLFISLTLAAVALVCAVLLARSSLPSIPSVSLAAVAAACSLDLVFSPAFRSFIATSWQVATGYSGAMTFEGPSWELWFAVGIFALLSLTFVANRRALTLPVIAAILVSMFFGYKEGFVRQDLHVIYAFWTAFLVAGVVLRVSASNRLLAINAIVTVLAFFALSVVWRVAGAGGAPTDSLTPNAIARDFYRLSAARHSDADIASAYRDGLAPDRLTPAAVKAISDASVDAGPIETSIVFSNGFKWNPQPVFQAYSAYTPNLIESMPSICVPPAPSGYCSLGLDRRRYPLWDQPVATREMLCNYGVDSRIPGRIATAGGEELLVVRRVADRCGVLAESAAKNYSWGEAIPVTASGKDLAFLKLRIRYSPLGQFLKLLFRAPPVHALVSDSQGQVTDYRIVVENSVDGLLIVPLPQSLEQLEALFEKRSIPRSAASNW